MITLSPRVGYDPKIVGSGHPPQVVGRYAIHGRIASGGMASVHFGRLHGAVGFSRTVAIKRLHPHLAEEPEFLSTMIDEARLAARIHHPNVVPTLDVVAVDSELLVVMEYVRGESFARLLRGESARERRVPLPIASAIVIGVLHGLHAAHDAKSDRGTPLGIVHRDVSPQNILVGIDGVARVIDFGVAKAAGRLQTTREGVVKGKLAYMAPEQLAAQAATRAVDVYAIGVVLWETIAGRRLFTGDSEAQVAVKVIAGAKEPPSRYASNLPAPLDALVMKALALDPADRFASAQEMAEQLLRIVPPAFPTDVGRWVEEVASEALAQRGAALAEIESSSEVASARPPAMAPERAGVARAPPVAAAEDDKPTVATQPSSLSVEKGGAHGASPSRRAKLAGAVGVVVLLGAFVVALVWRVAGASSSATAGASAAAVPSAPAPQAPESGVASAPTAVASAVPPALSTTALEQTSRPAVPAARPRPLPRPAGSIRFANPD